MAEFKQQQCEEPYPEHPMGLGVGWGAAFLMYAQTNTLL